jgi:hydroxyquinol 1,2-dioxygenase
MRLREAQSAALGDASRRAAAGSARLHAERDRRSIRGEAMSSTTGRQLTERVIRLLSATEERRLKKIMECLIRHVHDFVRETELTEAEWFAAIQFLTETGQMCDSTRQEFILLSDVLGVSMLVDAINHPAPKGITESTVLGPFYLNGAKALPHGANIMRGKGGAPTVVSGRVLTPAGKPIANALLDVWQTGPNALYDVQDPKVRGQNLRGKFRTDAQGGFWFRTVKPVSYAIANDGPVGKLLRRLGRHPFRPAHLHFRVSAKGYEPLTTHLFVKGDKYLASDAVFGVKDSLIADFERHTGAAAAKRYRVKTPFYTLNYDFRLRPATAKPVKRLAQVLPAA